MDSIENYRLWHLLHRKISTKELNIFFEEIIRPMLKHLLVEDCYNHNSRYPPPHPPFSPPTRRPQPPTLPHSRLHIAPPSPLRYPGRHHLPHNIYETLPLGDILCRRLYSRLSKGG